MSGKLRVGIVGVGIGRSHAKGYNACEDVEIAAVCDADAERLSVRAEEFGVSETYTDWKRMFAEAKLDAVSVCLPNHLHAPCAIDALEAGLHVFLEKPIARNALEGARIVRAADRAGRKLVMAYCNRFRKSTQQLRALIDEGKFGEFYYGRTMWWRKFGVPKPGGWFGDAKRSGGGPIIDLGIHWLDHTWYLMGRPNPIAAAAVVGNKVSTDLLAERGKDPISTEDFGAAFVRFENGAALTLETSWAAFASDETIHTRYVLLGTKGGIELRGETPTMTGPAFGGVYDMKMPIHRPLDIYLEEVRNFVAACRGEAEPVAPGRDGLAAMRMVDAIYRSAREGREVEVTSEDSLFKEIE